MKTAILVVFMLLIWSAVAQAGFVCNECHSKNPKLRAMHKAMGYKGCENCHASRGDVKFSDEAKRNKNKDPRCTGCHK